LKYSLIYFNSASEGLSEIGNSIVVFIINSLVPNTLRESC
jgi:hypothetical protein